MGESQKFSGIRCDVNTFYVIPILNKIALSAAFSLENVSMILSGVIFGDFSCSSFPWLPVTHVGMEWSLVRKAVLVGQVIGLDVLLPHLIMSAFEFVDELGGWF